MAMTTNSNQVIWELYALIMSCHIKCEDDLNKTYLRFVSLLNSLILKYTSRGLAQMLFYFISGF